jgi:hypothetical protein
MATTTNFGWTTPDDTDLVKDGAAAIRTLGSSIDTSFVDLKGGTTGQVLTKASGTDLDFNFTTPAGSPITTEGDLIIGDASGDAVRLPIGSAGTVLTSDGDTADWAAPATTESYTLLNAGGTALTGATTITVSGLSGYNNLHIIIETASSANASSVFTFKFNSAGANHTYYSNLIQANNGYSASVFDNNYASNGGSVNFGKMSSNQNSVVVGYIKIYGANTTTVKPFHYSSGGSTSSGVSQESYNGGGYFDAAAVISTFSLISSTGNFDSGNIFIYGSVV